MRPHLRLVLASSVLALGLLAGCGGSGPAAGTPSAATASRVELGEMQIGDGSDAFKIHADGSFDSPKGERIGSVRANGELVDGQGKVVATLGADGKVDLGPEANGTTATITADGTLTVTQKSGETFTVVITDDGKVTGTNPSAGKLTITGANTAGKKRAALLVLLGVTMVRESGPAAPPTSEPAPAGK